MYNKLKDLKNALDEVKKLQQNPELLNGIESVFNNMGIDKNMFEKKITELISYKAELKFSKITDDAVSPKYNYESDSGFDLHSTEDIIVSPLGRALVSTGLKFDIPNGYEIQVRPKSGLALKEGLTVLNTPGTVDCFSEDMKVLTIDGEKSFKDLLVGDIVYSLNEKTLDIEKQEIIKKFDTDVQDILIIETENGVLEVTPNSEIYTTDGIVLAKDLTFDHKIIVF